MRIRSNPHQLNFVQYKVKMAKGIRREMLSCINLPIHIEVCLSWILEESQILPELQHHWLTLVRSIQLLQPQIRPNYNVMFFKIAIACCWSWFLYKQTSEKEKASKSLALNITYLNCVCGLPQVIWRSR